MATQQQASSFVYIAASAAGSRTLGVRAATDRRELAQELRDDHLLLLRAWRMPGGAAPGARMGLKSEAAMHAQLATLVGRGVPLTESLDVAGSVLDARAAARLRKVREQVAGGATFADALERVGGFDPVAIGVYRAAEKSGALSEAADRLALAARRRLDVAQRIATMLIYPAIVFTIVVGVALVMLLVVVPMVGSALEQLGVTLPWYTRALLGASQWLRANLLSMSLAAVALAALLMTARDSVKRLGRRTLAAIPTVGSLRQAGEQARLFSVLAAMTRSGVPVAEALSVATGALSPGPLRAELTKLQRDLVEGGVLRDLLDRAKALPLATRKLLVAADKSGDLDAAFESLAEDAAKDVDKRAERLLVVIEPALLIVMFLFVGLLAFAIMYPIVTAAAAGVG